MFNICRAPDDEGRLFGLIGDLLPTVEGRSWSDNLSYRCWGDYYIEKLYGYIVPPASGDYCFYISGDETAALFLSKNEVRESAELIASISKSTSQYSWHEQKSQNSDMIYLLGNKAYYFELWHSETEGDDHVALAWVTPSSGKTQSPILIPSEVISSYTGGVPGVMNRLICPGDISFSVPVPRGESGGDGPVYMKLSSNGKLLASSPIVASDFSSYEYPFHAYEGTGLGTTWSSVSSFPYIYTYGLNDWLYYQPSSYNPQVFYNYDKDDWMNISVSGSNVSITYYVCSLPSLANFESGFGDWSNDTSGDTADWTRYCGPTPSRSAGTGPSADHTYKTSSGYYAYVETSSGGASTNGGTAALLGPAIRPDSLGAYVSFYYHMYGSNIGSLKLQEKRTDSSSDNKKNWSTLATWSGNKGDGWNPAQVYIAPTSNSYPVKLRLLMTAAGGSLGDIAIDDVRVFNSGTDSDADGLYDEDEFRYGRSVTTAEYTSDSDSDGLPSWLEYSLRTTGFSSRSITSDGSAITSFDSLAITSTTVKLTPGQPNN